MTTPSISVVIPTLNEEENLPECLENLTPQVNESDEVIIVDGGSDDATQEIALRLDCRVLKAPDSSIGRARALGTEKSNGEVVATTDADTLPPVGWLNTIRSHFKQDEDLDVLWGSISDYNGVPIRNITGKFSTLLGGASGNNTAYRRESYESLKKNYPDISFMEDVAIIGRLAKSGKAKRDSNMVMVMNMDRRRYQTIPIMGLSAATAIASTKVGGKYGKVGRGVALGMLATESTYEKATDTPFHHDQIGAAMSAVGTGYDFNRSDELTGIGIGMVVHHDMTEGISALPSLLQKNTVEEVKQ